MKINSKDQNIVDVTPATLNMKSHKEAPMEALQPDKTGVYTLLKLASLVAILVGTHTAIDIIVQLLLVLFFAIILGPLVTWLIRRGV